MHFSVQHVYQIIHVFLADNVAARRTYVCVRFVEPARDALLISLLVHFLFIHLCFTRKAWLILKGLYVL